MRNFTRFWLLFLVKMLLAVTTGAQTISSVQCFSPDHSPVELRRLLAPVLPVEQSLRRGSGIKTIITYVPLRVNIIRLDNGTGGISPEEIYRDLLGTNQMYINAHIQFYICGSINYINQTQYYEYTQAQESAVVALAYDDNALNLYYPNNVNGGHGGYAYLAGNTGYRRVFMAYPGLHATAHELGHMLGLPHPHANSNSSNIADRELVRRTNCLTTGDLVCDTPADPWERPGATYANCVFTGTITDANGDLYSPMMSNTMNYYFCDEYFTPGQYARIEATRQAVDGALHCTSTAPAAPTNLTAVLQNDMRAGIRLTWVNQATNALGYFIERSTAGSDYVSIANVSASTTTYLDEDLTSYTTYQYRVKPINAEAGWSNVASAQTQLHYCLPHYASLGCPPVSDGYIAKVEVRQGTRIVMSNAQNGCGNYSVFPTKDVALLPGSTYTLDVDLALNITQNGYVPQHVSAWVDYNHNGSFADPGERIYQSVLGQPPVHQTATFTVPAGVTSQFTRMRVRSQYMSLGPVTNACTLANSDGEAEDYPVTLGTPTATTISVQGQEEPTVFPTPTQSHFQVMWPTASSEYTLTLLDMQGRCLRVLPAQTGTSILVDVQLLASGVYIIEVKAKGTVRHLRVEKL